MARQIVWTPPAEKDRKDILAYWLNRNGSPTYSLKLFERFQLRPASCLRIRSSAGHRTLKGSAF